ncbi:MAG: GNAT family N-acetyltransferase [Chloracidobacterium sp.]|nr:GNAT family N-acetyltransferase [Chloracidobacterium sp.]
MPCLKDGTPIGNCGFVRRDTPGPDIGFAFLPEYERQGYGFESSQALSRYGREGLDSLRSSRSRHSIMMPRSGRWRSSASASGRSSRAMTSNSKLFHMLLS